MEKPLQVCGRAHFFFCGVTRVWASGERQADTADAPILVIAPHTSYFDAVILFAVRTIPSHVGRIENKQIPLLGSTYDIYIYTSIHLYKGLLHSVMNLSRLPRVTLRLKSHEYYFS